jgi:hypothetical protein
MDEPPFALVCGWRYPLLIIAKGSSFSTVSTLRLYSSTSIACGFLYEEKQSVPDGERPVVHIAIVCGFWQGASFGAHPVFVLPLIF